MACTPKQEKLMDDLMAAGAPIPADHNGEPDFSMLKSIPAADAYIKANLHYLAPKFALIDMSKRNTPDMWNVPNH
jgi:hypothetical protein